MEEETRKIRVMQRRQRAQKISGLEMNGVRIAGY
jgi:hypothetical protein